MTFAWNSIQTSLEHVFSDAIGIPFAWADSIKRLPRAPIGVLSLGQSRTVGRDSYQYKFRDSDVLLDMYGYRELTINIQIRARPVKNTPSSRVLAEKARLALANPMYRDELRSAGLIFVETHPLLNVNFDHSGSKELRSSFDVVFRLVLQEEMPATKAYFDAIELENCL